MNRPLVSVVMAVRNGSSDVLPSVVSILEQSVRDLELIIVDDGSTDDTLQVLRSVRDGRIRLLSNGTNRGLAASLNRGIALAVSPYIARMDADDIAFPSRFERQIELLEQSPELSLTGTGAVLVTSDGSMGAALPLACDHDEICKRGLRGSFPLYHPTWMGRTAWFRHYGYDPVFQKSQDYELLLRARADSRFANVPEVLLGYRYDMSESRQKRFRSRLYTLAAMRKNLGGTALLAGTAFTLAKTCADALLPLGLLHKITGGHDRAYALESILHEQWRQARERTMLAVPRYVAGQF